MNSSSLRCFAMALALTTALIPVVGECGERQADRRQLRDQGLNYFRKGKPELAMRTLEQSARLPGAEKDPRLHFGIYKVALKLARPGRALKALKAADKAGGDRRKLEKQRAWMASQGGYVRLLSKGHKGQQARFSLEVTAQLINPWKKRVVEHTRKRLHERSYRIPLRIWLPFASYSINGVEFEHRRGSRVSELQVPVPVVVILRGNGPRFEQPVEPFQREVAARFVEFVVGRKELEQQQLVARVQALKPDMAFTLGTRATALLQLRWPTLPLVFGMVPRWDELRLTEQSDNVAGVAFRAPPEITLSWLRRLVPRARRVGLLLPKGHSKEWRVKVELVAKELGIKLLPLEVSHPKGLVSVAKSLLGKVDALWLPPDARVLEPVTVKRFFDESLAVWRLPVVTSSAALVNLGALLAVQPHGARVGTQAGVLARRILEDEESPGDLDVQQPSAVDILVNEASARRLGLKISAKLRQRVQLVAAKEGKSRP